VLLTALIFVLDLFFGDVVLKLLNADS
jgi:hypothetical protein